jgi:hypothetical protein
MRTTSVLIIFILIFLKGVKSSIKGAQYNLSKLFGGRLAWKSFLHLTGALFIL